jgi:predicted DNA-binding transcriptional regulator YafY
MKKQEQISRRTMLARIYYIDRQIGAGTYPNTRTLAEAWECGTATISRDLDFLRDMMEAPIEYDPVKRGYYYSDTAYRLPSVFGSPEAILALGMAKNFLSLYQHTPIYEKARELIDSIVISAPWYEDRIITPPVPAAPVAEKLWDCLCAALRENRILTFLYQGTWDEDFVPRRVQPWQLLFDNGLWFLYGYAEERKAPRLFSLARIKNAVLTEEIFTLPADYDYRARYSNAVDGSFFGVFAGGRRYHFRLVFYGESVVWAGDRKWAADQRAEPGKTEKGDCLFLDFTSTQYEKVLEWMLSQGGNVKPLEPAELAADWKRHIADMNILSGKDTDRC